MNLPKYRSHKVVEAFKISRVEPLTREELPSSAPEAADVADLIADGALLHPEAPTLPAVRVSAEYVAKHSPKLGGYYVRYPDGYESFSPADSFESGYTPVVGHPDNAA